MRDKRRTAVQRALPVHFRTFRKGKGRHRLRRYCSFKVCFSFEYAQFEELVPTISFRTFSTPTPLSPTTPLASPSVEFVFTFPYIKRKQKQANANAVGVAYRLWMRGSVVKLYIDAFSKDYTYDYWVRTHLPSLFPINYRKNNVAFQCVGHGPGAVVADVLCFLMADDSHGDNDAYLTTFGSPRPGYLDFVEEREANVSSTCSYNFLVASVQWHFPCHPTR